MFDIDFYLSAPIPNTVGTFLYSAFLFYLISSRTLLSFLYLKILPYHEKHLHLTLYIAPYIATAAPIRLIGLGPVCLDSGWWAVQGFSGATYSREYDQLNHS